MISVFFGCLVVVVVVGTFFVVAFDGSFVSFE
jgi:hypothetical protein